MLCVIDNGTRECLGLVADTSLSGLRVARELDAIAAVRGLPSGVVSDNGRLRDECLNETVFTSLRHARTVLAAWRGDYNEVRPHSALGGRAPGSISLPPCSPASSPLRAGFAGGLRPGLTQTARDDSGACGRGGETALDRTEKLRHDRHDDNCGLYF